MEAVRGLGCIVGGMTSLSGVFVGVILLLFGRRLYWLFVAGIGFLTGLALVPDLLPGLPEWLILLAALVAAIVGAIVALFAQKLTIGLIGFVAGGGIGLVLLRKLGLVGEGSAWVVYLIAGIVGLVLILILFDWALILLSSLAGANLIVTGTSAHVHLPRETWFLALIALALIGVVVQAGWCRRAGRVMRGRSGGPRPGSTSG
jgi:hypothetical protein